MRKLGIIIPAVIVLAGFAIWIAVQNEALKQARAENESLKQQLDQVGQLATENERLSNFVAQATGAGNDQNRELLRLRSEVGMLRHLTNEAARLRQQNTQLTEALANAAASAKASPTVPSSTEDTAVAHERAMMYAKLNDAKNIMLQLIQHNAPQDSYVLINPGVSTNSFEQVYSGSLENLSNAASLIVIREKEAYQGLEGQWLRAYGFADGHSEVHAAQDGNFDAWEKQHSALPPQSAQPGP